MVTGGSNFPFGEMRCWWSFWSVERVEVSPGSKGLLVAGWVLQERQTIGVVWSVDLVGWLVGFLLMVMVESLFVSLFCCWLLSLLFCARLEAVFLALSSILVFWFCLELLFELFFSFSFLPVSSVSLDGVFSVSLVLVVMAVQ